MENLTFQERVRKERKRLIRELKKAEFPADIMKVFSDVIENTAWMKVKLDNLRAILENSDVVIEYDNGGGQKGIRENPIFKAYLSLWKNYMLGMGRILDALPDEKRRELEKETEAVKPVTVLEQISQKHRDT